MLAVPQFTTSQKDMNDELREDGGPTKHLGRPQMSKTVIEAGLDVEVGEQLLKQDQPRERGQGLVLESQFGDAVNFAANVRPAILHCASLRGLR